MNDVLEQTHPPQQFRCNAHEAFTLKVENRITTLETNQQSTTAAVDRLEVTQRALVTEIRGQMGELNRREESQNGRINELSGRVKISDVIVQRDEKRTDKTWERLIPLAKAIGMVVAAAIGAGGMSFVMSCNG